jgi:heme/copper-type cytochrome/quinol oxidase subunit 4
MNEDMNNQQVRSDASQEKLTLGAIGLCLVVAIVAGLFFPHADLPSTYLNIIASISILAGILGLYIAAARQFGLWLPSFLRVAEKSRDQFWRLLAMSMAAIVFPIIIIAVQRILFH